MNHREIDPDEAIDRLLTGLRDVEPPQGMQGRILIVARERTVSRRVWNPMAMRSRAKVWKLATASVATAAIAIIWMMNRTHLIEHNNAELGRHVAYATVSTAQIPMVEIRSVQQIHAKRVLATQNRKATAVEHLSAEDSVALSEMKAPSHPAPPMPLTEQELLLIRILRKGDPVELAMLDPKFRTNEEASRRADFDRFFAPPPSPDAKPTTGENQ